jgi:hypothetical protein
MSRRFLALMFVVAAGSQALATTADFNSLAAGTHYSAGALFSSGGLDFDVVYSGGTVDVSTATGLVNPSFTGNYLNLSSDDYLNVNLPTRASQVGFDFILNDPGVALDVNGTLGNYSQIPTTVNGVTIAESLGSKTAPWGSIHASGTLTSFVIIGNQFAVDNVNVTPLAGVAGDYNRNNAVDAGDFVVWRKSIGSVSGFRSWRTNFGAGTAGSGDSVGISAGNVPEPSTLASVLLGLLFLAATPGRRG